jgi:catechol-2,3-dioxygenase
VIGLETTERVAGRFVFMSFGAEHHDLALQQIRGRWGSTFAVEVDGERELPMRSIASSRLASPTGRSTTGSRRRSILSDPYGHGIEIYCDARSARGRGNEAARSGDAQA